MSPRKPNQEAAVSDSQEVELSDQNAVELVMGEVLPEVEDRDAAARSIVEDIMRAGTLGELFKQRTTVATKDLVGEALLIRDVRMLRSTLPDSKTGVWMLIDAVKLASGEVISVNTGSRNIMALLLRGKMQGTLPVEVVVIEAGRKRPGENAPLSLAPYGKTAEQIQKELAA
jgi:hypothetical protein